MELELHSQLPIPEPDSMLAEHEQLVSVFNSVVTDIKLWSIILRFRLKVNQDSYDANFRSKCDMVHAAMLHCVDATAQQY